MLAKSQAGKEEITINYIDRTFTSSINNLYAWRSTQIELDSCDSQIKYWKYKFDLKLTETNKLREKNVELSIIKPIYESKISEKDSKITILMDDNKKYRRKNLVLCGIIAGLTYLSITR